MIADPLERLVADAVLYRLDTPDMADTLAGRCSADERTQELTHALDEANEQLEELCRAYANRDITMREWMTAKKPITEQARRQPSGSSASITRTNALAGLVGNGDRTRPHLGDLNLSRQHAIVTAVVDHAVIGPGTPGVHSPGPRRA